jgi:hypothetical protein
LAESRANGPPGQTFAEIGRRLGISKQAAWHPLGKAPAGHTAGVRCCACQRVVATRHFQLRTVGEVLCPSCLAAHPARRSRRACDRAG